MPSGDEKRGEEEEAPSAGMEGQEHEESPPSGESPPGELPPAASTGGAPIPPIPPSVGYVVYVPYLRAWRESRGYTREALAARTVTPEKPVAISLYTFRQIEAYGRPAKYGTVQRIADALTITVDELLHVDPSKLPPRQRP